METFVEAIRTATAADASVEARATGAAACRAVLASLEPAPAQALAVIPPDAVPQLLAMVGKMDLNQLLDVAIERLRALNAANPSPKAEEPPRQLSFQLVPVPSTLKRGS